MQKISSLSEFRAHIARQPKATLDAYFSEIEALHQKARAADIRLGYAMALDALVQEAEMRARGYAAPDGDVPSSLDAMTDDELLAELMA